MPYRKDLHEHYDTYEFPEQPGDDLVKEDFVDAHSALGSGYSESKWVCESILSAASRSTSLKPVVVRVGQLSGISTSGCWNTKEWVPALVKSSVHIGCLPLIENVRVSSGRSLLFPTN